VVRNALALRTENDGISHLEDWSFVYKKVEWTHEIAGTSGADDWNS
jgi:type VI secretion system secreted protein Hcp